MRGAGLEPAPGCPEGILSPPRLPFRHPRKSDVGGGMWVTADQVRIDRLSGPPTSHLPHPVFQSGKRDSNPRPQPWQGCALPTELFPQRLIRFDQYSDFTAGLASLKGEHGSRRPRAAPIAPIRRVTSHESRVTNHESRVTSHESRVTEQLPTHAPHTTPNTPAGLPAPHRFRSRSPSPPHRLPPPRVQGATGRGAANAGPPLHRVP